MTDPTPDNPSRVDLVRRYCDDEMPADERRAFEERLEREPDLQTLVRNERTLRGWVGRSMGDGPEAPVDLERRVRDRLAAAANPESELVGRSWLAGPKRVNAFAVAACFALVAGAVLFGIFGPTVDDMRHRGSGNLVAETVQFVMDEHHRCAARPVERDAKVRWTDVRDAERAMRDRLPAPVRVVDLDSKGYSFHGVGDGGLPGAPNSVHVVYAQKRPAIDGCPQALTSLFIVPDRGQFDGALDPPLVPNSWRVIAEGKRPRGRVAVMSRDGLLYFLVCCNDADLEGVAAAVGE